ncbi:uncharacterized protein BXZ73DRAFT_101002 [Epithele typhae]|uniref:uncharacterized protein n=1 Tax=Epithele typhae TaxID=378194 RepID=UPI002008A58C|nr:uncharacterized protein BXZ73DRAFT_101002 [Epithele typhae]KAH9933615.1 hypothetical protein BXZ73DRAFT_101002 [Epithele typhae]
MTGATDGALPQALLDALPSLEPTFGAMLVGSFLSFILFGVSLLQGYTYARNHYSDPIHIIALVALVVLLDTTHMVLIAHAAYYYLVSHYFDPVHLQLAVWSLNLLTPIGAAIACATQMFFARRVSLISFRYKFVAGVSAVCSAGTAACSVVLTVKAFQSGSTSFATEELPLRSILFSCATVTAVSLTLSLVGVLQRAGRMNKEAHTVSEFITHYVVNTGIVILIADLTTLILTFALPGTLYWSIFYLISIRLDSITLLSVLNSRKLLFTELNILGGNTVIIDALSHRDRLAQVARYNVPQLPSETPPSIIDIRVTTEMENHVHGHEDESVSHVGVEEKDLVLAIE